MQVAKKNRSTWHNTKYLIKEAWGIDKPIFIYFGLFTVLSALIPFTSIFFPKFLIDELTGSKSVENLVLILSLFFIVSVIIKYSCTRLNSSIFPKLILLRFDFIYRIQKKNMIMDFKHTENPNILNDNQSAWRAIMSNDNGIEGVYRRIFSIAGSSLSFIGYIAIVLTFSPLVLLYLVINVLMTYFLTLRVKKYEHSLKDDISKYDRRTDYINKVMYDFSYGKDIRIFAISDWISAKYKMYKSKRIDIDKKIKKKYLAVELIDLLLALFREGLIYIYLIYSVIYNGMSIGNFTMYFATISGFALWMRKVMDDIVFIRAQNLYINDYRDYINIENDKQLGDVPIPKLHNSQYEIEFKDVSFKYPNTSKYIYKNISFKIKAGEKLAIVGINGAGKTTLVKLITRLYDPTSGKILLNGIDISRFNKEEYYRLFSVVFQEIKMMAFSISENIALHHKDIIDNKKVINSIQRAGIEEKINSLSNGIDTSILKIIDPKGVELSGGEYQRLALARALYKNGDIVILDEPTAALDPIAEYNIYKSFDDLVDGKTAIYISHRLASTRFCDSIAFFENGRIIEKGTHEELLELKGKYAEMFNIQAQYYKTKEVVNL